MIPSAFTSLSPSLKSLKPSARMRIVAAGAWHNLLFYGLIYVLRSGYFDEAWSMFGWEDASDLGKVVLSVDSVCWSLLFRVIGI